jgi:hypothetical protein
MSLPLSLSLTLSLCLSVSVWQMAALEHGPTSYDPDTVCLVYSVSVLS